MKRVSLIILLIISFSFSFMGCSKDSGSKNTEPATVNLDYCVMDQSGSDVIFKGLSESGKQQENFVVPECDVIAGSLADGILKNVTFESDKDIDIINMFTASETLETVKLPANIAYLKTNAFGSCTALKEIVLPQGITVIPSMCFCNDSSLETVTLEGDVTEIESMAFKGCRSLKSINLPDSITTIGNQAFHTCGSLKSVTLPKGLKSIGSNVFVSNSGVVETFIIPEEMELESWDDTSFVQLKGSYTVKVTKGSWADIHFDEVFQGQVVKEYKK